MNTLLKILVLGLFFVPSFALASFDTDLRYGSKGDDVTALQEFLTDQGVYAGPISRNFYSLTLSAVRKFQKAQGISPVSGYVGPITRGVINGLLESVSFDSEGDATTTPIVNIPKGALSSSAATSSDVSQITSADVKVNGSDGPVTVAPDGCIQAGVKTCAHAEVEWSGTGQCGIVATPSIGWSGNNGASGSKQGQFILGTSTVTFSCGDQVDTVQVIVQ